MPTRITRPSPTPPTPTAREGRGARLKSRVHFPIGFTLRVTAREHTPVGQRGTKERTRTTSPAIPPLARSRADLGPKASVPSPWAYSLTPQANPEP